MSEEPVFKTQPIEDNFKMKPPPGPPMHPDVMSQPPPRPTGPAMQIAPGSYNNGTKPIGHGMDDSGIPRTISKSNVYQPETNSHGRKVLGQKGNKLANKGVRYGIETVSKEAGKSVGQGIGNVIAGPIGGRILGKVGNDAGAFVGKFIGDVATRRKSKSRRQASRVFKPVTKRFEKGRQSLKSGANKKYAIYK